MLEVALRRNLDYTQPADANLLGKLQHGHRGDHCHCFEVRPGDVLFQNANAAEPLYVHSFLPGVNLDGIERVHIRAPWNWQPSVDRPWVINPMKDIPTKGILGALFPAFMLYLLFFIDHNISSILTQAPKYNLKKPSAFHWDFFCLGVTIIPCGILGLPPGSGLIPQAPLHTRALATRKFVEKHGVRTEVTTHVEEQRWSALGQACLMFVALCLTVAISWIPKGALFGVFLYLGVGAMHGNEVCDDNCNVCLSNDLSYRSIPRYGTT